MRRRTAYGAECCQCPWPDGLPGQTLLLPAGVPPGLPWARGARAQGHAPRRPRPARRLPAHDLGGEVVGQLLVLAELHAIRGAALRVRAQGRDVAEHAGQGHVGTDDFHVTTVTDVVHQASPRVEVADDVAHVLLGGGDLHFHHRLQYLRAALLGVLLPRVARGDLEGNRRGINGVNLPIYQLHLYVDNWKAGLDAVEHLALSTPQDPWDELPRDNGASGVVHELVPLALVRLV
mmetsp:Transcript_1721/g.4841  ORF Transcript_1721/g.4841 Transcript_1721/m.4841 type:complete len:234 (-) Transcript_1721:1363-2064(-)